MHSTIPMLECIVFQFAIAINIHTMDTYQIYKCNSSDQFKYLNRDKEYEGVYDINSGLHIITNERKGI